MGRVAVVGLGAMGSRIALRLLASGRAVVVWNRTAKRTEALVAAGATAASTPAEAAAQAEAVITMVADPSALLAITDGPDGIAAGATASTTILQMSTVGPAAVARLAAALPQEAGVLDAPVLGSLSEVEAGSLTIFVGGDQPLVARFRPLLRALGRVVHVGGLGAGSSAKLVANSTLFGALGVLGEALALGRRLGLSVETVLGVLEATPLAAQAERRRRALETGEYPLRFSLTLARKDTDLLVEAAAAAHLDLKVAAAVRAWFADAEAAGRGADDYSAVLPHVIGKGDG